MRVAKKKKANKQNIVYSGDLSPVENKETTLIQTEKFAKYVKYPPQETHDKLMKALGVKGYGSCSTAEQLRIFKKYVPALINSYYAMQEALAAAAKNEERTFSKINERANKKWDKDEDELLIDLASQDDYTTTKIAVYMGRTPSAIQSRISYLVGIKKLSQEIAGRFIGTLNGQSVNGYIEGSVLK